MTVEEEFEEFCNLILSGKPLYAIKEYMKITQKQFSSFKVRYSVMIGDAPIKKTWDRINELIVCFQNERDKTKKLNYEKEIEELSEKYANSLYK